MDMLKNYLQVVIRNLWKNKFFSILNISGLAIGMACYLLIFQYVSFELSYDEFHENKRNIYRLQRNVFRNNELKASLAQTSYNLGHQLKAEYPEIRDVVRCSRYGGNTVSYGERKFKNEKIYITEPSFFNIFSIPLSRGKSGDLLKGPNKVVISASMARKYFADENPVGKILDISDMRAKHSCLVEGVFRDLPENSHMKFDILLSLGTIWQSGHSDWIYSQFHTYVLLTGKTTAAELQTKFPAFIKKFIVKHVPLASNWKILLQPMGDIHLYSHLTYDTNNADSQTVYFLLLIAIVVLVISWINYINLSTARAMDRAREVGVRKVLGGHRVGLIKQFLLESLVVNVIPLVVALGLTGLFLPYLRELTGTNLPDLFSGGILFAGNLAMLYFAGSILSGLYPAFVLSSFKAVTVLKRSKLSHTTGGALLRKLLVTFQFGAAVVLIIVAYSVYNQVEYMRNRDLGIDISGIMGIALPAMPADDGYLQRTAGLKTELLRYPTVKSVTGSSNVPGNTIFTRRFAKLKTEHFKTGRVQPFFFVDYDFFSTYRIRLAAGRLFSKEHRTDDSAVVINEVSAGIFGFNQPGEAVGREITLYGMKKVFKIIGVIKDYHHQSMKETRQPIIFLLEPEGKNYYSLKLDTGAAISSIRGIWDGIFPGYPFEYFFLEDHIDRQYKADGQLGRVLGIFVILAVLITVLGVLGLAYFNSLQRTKEIGIRKTFGAGPLDIMRLLTRDLLKLVIVSTLAAWPVSYLLVSRWLENYAYRAGMPYFFFLLAGMLVVVIILFTVAYHTVNAAKARPVETLREE
ncbi:MAG: ABC transporter permease [bacterium]|nr:ABC transporter permease [bacterium]